MKDEDFNFYGIASFLHTQIKDRCIRAGFEPKINITSSKVDMIMQMSAKRKGICILPRPYAERRLLPGLKLIPFEEPYPWISCFVKNKKLYQSYVSRLFEQYVVNYFRQRYSASEEDGPGKNNLRL